MERPCLNDKDEFPSDEVLSFYLGKVKTVWDSFMDFLGEEYPSFTGQWRYYDDGKSWLYKLTKKKKTISWISVWHNMFKTTFYFPDRAEELIIKSKLKKEYKDKFGFPFILTVKNHTKASLLEVFARRLQNTVDIEMVQALTEIAQIAKFRLLELVE